MPDDPDQNAARVCWPGDTRTRILQAILLVSFCLATVLLIPLEQFLAGGIAWCVAMTATMLRGGAFRRRMGILLAAVALLAVAPIHTDRSTRHFLTLGFFFSLAVFGPWLILRKTDPGVMDWRFWPRRFRRLDVLYTLLSVPLSWVVIPWYFFQATPEMPTHWPMPVPYTEDGFWRLIVGINAVGIWDELFFVNTVYAILRTLLPAFTANVVQAVVYTAVLYDMAFTGVGPFLVYAFALTQGAMYESSRNLLYVLVVHLVVDAFLISGILHYYYPVGAPLWF